MKAITLWEPWASAMALGLKHNETRSWPTSYRGDLLICAAKRKMTQDEQETFDILVRPDTLPNYEIPYGKAICIVELYDCVPTAEFHETVSWKTGVRASPLSERESALGNYERGRFAWLTRNLRRIVPVPIVGRQGLWTPQCGILQHMP